MIRAVLIGLLVVCSGTLSAQTASVPTVILDSLIYETKVGRQCSQVVIALQEENKAIGVELVHTNKALTLSQRSNETLSSLLNNSRDASVVQGLQFQKDLQTERKKTKRWRKVAVLETLGIVGLIILML